MKKVNVKKLGAIGGSLALLCYAASFSQPGPANAAAPAPRASASPATPHRAQRQHASPAPRRGPRRRPLARPSGFPGPATRTPGPNGAPVPIFRPATPRPLPTTPSVPSPAFRPSLPTPPSPPAAPPGPLLFPSPRVPPLPPAPFRTPGLPQPGGFGAPRVGPGDVDPQRP